MEQELITKWGPQTSSFDPESLPFPFNIYGRPARLGVASRSFMSWEVFFPLGGRKYALLVVEGTVRTKLIFYLSVCFKPTQSSALRRGGVGLWDLVLVPVSSIPSLGRVSEIPQR